jgi:4-hydroxy-3-polyprenylbenzoate decarboxylase
MTTPPPDLRTWLDAVDRLSQLQRVRGAHWDLEIGALAELTCTKLATPPTLLFDEIPDYPPGYRVVTNILSTVQRLALTLGLPTDLDERGFIQAWRRRLGELDALEPEEVPASEAPVFENRFDGEAVDLMCLPVPRYHAQDGGRYVGTANLDITRDRETGWVNAGTYRVMLQDAQHLGFFISPGKHGRVHRQQYFDAGEPCPVAISFGHDPLLFLAATIDVPHGQSEYAWAGGVRGEPVRVVRGPLTGLPLPATAEIVIEGEAVPGETRVEGPFGEWTGYYASASRPEPVIRVKALYHRDHPILMGAPPFKPSAKAERFCWLLRSAAIWNQVEAAGVPDVQGVRVHPAAGRFFVIISIRQRYPGHAKQAAHVASQCRAGAYLGRYVIVVDEDVDIYDTDEVLWALATRSEPAGDIDIIRRAWSGPLDPIIPPDQKGFSSRAIIDATKPFEWKDQFPVVSVISAEQRAAMEARWGELFRAEGRPAVVEAPGPVLA